MLVFRKILRTYLMDHPNSDSKQQELLGKEKDFVYSENSCNKIYVLNVSLIKINYVKFDEFINNASLDPLNIYKLTSEQF